MPKDKKPRRRRPASPAETPAPQPEAPEVLPVPRAQSTVESRRHTEAAPFVAQMAGVIRTVAVAVIDFADATAEAVMKRLEA